MNKLPVAVLEVNTPQVLRSSNSWIAWKDVKGRKRPFRLDGAGMADTSNPATWGSFDDAIAVWKANPDVGIGYCLTRSEGLLFIDLDACFLPGGVTKKWAVPIIEAFAGVGYMEVSPSGSGLHIITQAAVPRAFRLRIEGPDVKDAVEAYMGRDEQGEGGRYMTITGSVWKGQRTVGNGQAAVETMLGLIPLDQVDDDDSFQPPIGDEGRVILPLEELGWMLALIPPDCSYNEWVTVGMVLHGMHGQAAFKLWDTWSAQAAEKYPGQFETRKKWASFAGVAANKVGYTRLRKIVEAYQPTTEPRPKITAGPDRDPDYIFSLKAGAQVILPTVRNMAEYFAWDAKWKGRVRMNWRTWVEIDGAPMKNSDWVDLAGVIAREWACKEPKKTDVFEAVEKAAHYHTYEPMQEYLSGLEWDGICRLDSWLITAGAEDTPATRMIGRRWMIGAAGRGLHEGQPGAPLEAGKGTKMDYCLVLEGPQGVRKSSLLAALSLPGLFFDSNFSFGKAGKAADLYMAMRRNFIVEMAELAGMTKSDVDDVKATLSSREDTYRPPYGRVVESFPRRSVLTGSVNESGWVRDFTGARRFWPVPCPTMLDPDYVTATRDQLWAEAVHLYRAGEVYWEDLNLSALLMPLHEERRDLPAWASRVEDFVKSDAVQERKYFRLNTLITTYPNELMKQSHRTIGAILRMLGWESRVFRVNNKSIRVWASKGAELTPGDIQEGGEVIEFESYKEKGKA